MNGVHPIFLTKENPHCFIMLSDHIKESWSEDVLEQNILYARCELM